MQLFGAVTLWPVLQPAHSHSLDHWYIVCLYNGLEGLQRRLLPQGGGGGGGYCHVWVIYVCTAVKGMVFKQFILG